MRTEEWIAKVLSVLDEAPDLNYDELQGALSGLKDEWNSMKTQRTIVAVDGSGSGYIGYVFEGAYPVITNSDRLVTGNEAEYMAVEFALKALLGTGKRGWKILSDSQLVVNQLNGNWKISEKFAPYVQRIRKLMKDADAIIEWSPKDFHIGKFVKEGKLR